MPSTRGIGVMRHPQMLWGQSIEGFLKNTLEEQRKQTDEASGGKGCRGRMSRKKTASDMGWDAGGSE